MSIEWDEVWEAALAAAGDSVKAEAPAANKHVRRIMEVREERLKLLLAAWADGALDEATLEEELRQEREILEMEFLAIQGLAKKTAQDAVNAIFAVLEDALITGISLTI